ncbi:hypothetical protein FRB99_003646 [Tulasnella sp. 403]|nr:hypothetical protein FRB99_003646 [Tulasnella sp. 403]
MITIDAFVVLTSGRKAVVQGNDSIVYQSTLPSDTHAHGATFRSLVIFPDCALQQRPIPGINTVRLIGVLYEAPLNIDPAMQMSDEAMIDVLIVSKESHPRSFPAISFISSIPFVPTFHISGPILHLTHKGNKWVTLEGYRGERSWYIGITAEFLHDQSQHELTVGDNISALGTFFRRDMTTDGFKSFLVFRPLFIDTLQAHSNISILTPLACPQKANASASSLCAIAEAYMNLILGEKQEGCAPIPSSTTTEGESGQPVDVMTPTTTTTAPFGQSPPSSPVLSATRKRSQALVVADETEGAEDILA